MFSNISKHFKFDDLSIIINKQWIRVLLFSFKSSLTLPIWNFETSFEIANLLFLFFRRRDVAI